MEPLGSIGSIPPKAAGSSHPTASAGKTVMLLSAKLREKLLGKQCSGRSAPIVTGKEPGASPALGPALPWAQGWAVLQLRWEHGSRILSCRASTGSGAERRQGCSGRGSDSLHLPPSRSCCLQPVLLICSLALSEVPVHNFVSVCSMV